MVRLECFSSCCHACECAGCCVMCIDLSVTLFDWVCAYIGVKEKRNDGVGVWCVKESKVLRIVVCVDAGLSVL